jgi:hypothetical protein
VNQFDIYRLEFQWRDCTDRRPVIVLSPQWYLDVLYRDDVLVAPLSSQSDLADRRRHFIIDPATPEGRSSKLGHKSYVAFDYVTHVTRPQFKPENFVGSLPKEQGANLLEAFRRFLASP